MLQKQPAAGGESCEQDSFYRRISYVVRGGEKVIVRWIVVIVFVVLPLVLLPLQLTNLKFLKLCQEGNAEQSVTFGYSRNYSVTCYDAAKAEESTDERCYVFLPSYANMASIEVTTQAPRVTFTKENKEISVTRNGSSICEFETDIPYTMCIYNARGKEVAVREVVFLKSGNMPTLYVTTETGSMEALDEDKDYKEGGSIELLDESGTVLFQDELRNISARGNQTFSYEKKSYKLNLSDAADLFGMGKSDSWILLSNVFDNTYMRNKLTYDMAVQADMYGSPESTYLDVYFNGSYGGMYMLCEKVEIGENRLELTDQESENEKLNGNLDDAYLTMNEDGTRKGVALSRNPDDITGGYLIERDYSTKYTDVISGFITDNNESFAIQSPQHASEQQVGYIADLMQEIEDAIRAGDGYNPDTGKHFTEYIDLESWADKYLIEEMTRNNGSGLSSSYFYKAPDSVSTKVFGGPVWDYDKAYARVQGYNSNIRDLAYMTLHSGENTQWFYYLNQHEEFVEAVKKEYREKFSDYLEVMANEKIEEYMQQIEESVPLDNARFSHVYQTFWDDRNSDFSQRLEAIRQFILERKAFLDEVWLEDAPICKVLFRGSKDNSNCCLGVIKGECIEALPEKSSSEERTFIGWQNEETGEMFTTETPVTEDIVLVGVWEEQETE